MSYFIDDVLRMGHIYIDRYRYYDPYSFVQNGGDSSVGKAFNWKASNTGMGLSPWCPCVQSHASTSVRTIKIPNTDTMTALPLFRHTKIQHTLVRMGSAALVAAMSYTGKLTWFSHKGQWSMKNKQNHTSCACHLQSSPSCSTRV